MITAEEVSDLRRFIAECDEDMNAQGDHPYPSPSAFEGIRKLLALYAQTSQDAARSSLAIGEGLDLHSHGEIRDPDAPPSVQYSMAAGLVAAGDEIERLRTRRDELLALVANISQSTPLDEEVKEALNQRGALLAEVGTLKARVAELEREVEIGVGFTRTAREQRDRSEARVIELEELLAETNGEHRTSRGRK